jgi:hypothetical protein
MLARAWRGRVGDGDGGVSLDRTLLAMGLLVARAAAVLLLLGVIGSGLGIALGVLGIGLVAVSSRSRQVRR